MDEDKLIEKRKEDIFKFLKKKGMWFVYAIFAVIAGLGYYIRTRNLGYLIDATTGKYIPLALDPFVFLRYMRYFLENGTLMSIDLMRYYPWGYSAIAEFKVLTYVVVYFYKFLNFFNPAITLEYVDVIYPVIAFVLSLVVFFFLVKRLFNWKVSLLATAFLSFAPAYLYRTMAGFSDKESLAMLFLFLCLYFFVRFVQERKWKDKFVSGSIGGLFLGLMGLVWGGVNFLFLIVGSFVLICVFLDKFNENDFKAYTLFLIVSFATLNIGYASKYSLLSLFNSTTSGLMVLAWAVALVNFIVFQRNMFGLKGKFKVPSGVLSLLGVLVLVVIGGVLAFGLDFIVGRISGVYGQLVNEATSRWILTVAESHQPYFTDWISQFGWNYIIMFFAGAVVLFYQVVKGVKEKYWLTFGFASFLILFSMSRYSASSVMNGESNLALLAYVGSLVVFIGGLAYYYLWKYYKDKENFGKFHDFDRLFVLVLISFFFFLMGARTAIRLVFSFVPVTAILASYFVFYVGERAWKLKAELYKFGVIVVVVLFAGMVLYNGYTTSIGQASYTGPSYNAQWQTGMDWVRDNTNEDAVFAHWWDYGYWVQTGGERATISDGGNAMAAVNHFTGRHLMTGQSDLEALQFLASREVTHVLMISDEIGKYGAYSSIGADADYDRYSWINTFNLDLSQTQETRNETVYVYQGGTALDDDFVYGDKLFPAYSAAVIAFLVPMEEENGAITILQPEAVLYYNGAQQNVPLSCIYYNGEEIIFGEGDDYFESCLMLIPTSSNGEVNTIGASLYLSNDVWNSRVAQWYLFGNEGEYVDLVYDDSVTGYPLMYYNGRLIGPLKIWEVSYPDDIEIPAEFYVDEVPDEVIQVNEDLT
jgi:asparagine N-glycosylation enzyme membrane subunit Stt3